MLDTTNISKADIDQAAQHVDTSQDLEPILEKSPNVKSINHSKNNKTIKKRKKCLQSVEETENNSSTQLVETLQYSGTIIQKSPAAKPKRQTIPSKSIRKPKKSIDNKEKNVVIENSILENLQKDIYIPEKSPDSKSNDYPDPTETVVKQTKRLNKVEKTKEKASLKRTKNSKYASVESTMAESVPLRKPARVRKTIYKSSFNFDDNLESEVQGQNYCSADSSDNTPFLPDQHSDSSEFQIDQISGEVSAQKKSINKGVKSRPKKKDISQKAKLTTKPKKKYDLKVEIAQAKSTKKKALEAVLQSPLSFPNLNDPSFLKLPVSKNPKAFDIHLTKLDGPWYQNLPSVLPSLPSLTFKEASLYPITFSSDSNIKIQIDENTLSLNSGDCFQSDKAKIINTGLDLFALDYCPDGRHLALAGQQPSSACRLGEIQAGPGTIQIWNIGDKPFLATTICHSFGTIFFLRWLPGYSPAINNSSTLGLLSCVSSDGEINIMTVSTGSAYVKAIPIIRLSLPKRTLICFEWSPASYPGRIVAGTSHGDLIAWDLNKSLPSILANFSSKESKETFSSITPPIRYICHLHLGLLTSANFTYDPILGLGVVTSGTDGFVCIHSWSSPYDFIRLHNQKSPITFLSTVFMPPEREPASLYVDSSNCLRWANLNSHNSKDKKRIVALGQILPLSISCIDHHNLVVSGTIDGTVSVFPFPHRLMSTYSSLLPAIKVVWEDDQSLLRINIQSSFSQIFPRESYPKTFLVDHCFYKSQLAFRCVSWNPIHSLLFSSEHFNANSLANYEDLPFKNITNADFLPEKAFELAAATASGIVILTRLHPDPSSI